MVLDWLREEKNQRLLAWITAAVVGGWTLFAHFNPVASDPAPQTPQDDAFQEICEADPAVLVPQAHQRLTQQRGAKDTGSRSLRNDNLLQQQFDIAQATLWLARKVRASKAEPDVQAAHEAFQRGDTQPTESLMRKDEQVLAAKGRKHEAAKLARERGALATSRDTAAAVEAYQQATAYEPDNFDTW